MAEHELKVELHYSSTWNDITEYVRTSRAVQISHGLRRPPGRGLADPDTLALTLENSNGRFSLKNPRSPLYGLVGIGTPVRVSVTYDGETYTRFVGTVSDMPVAWSLSGSDVTVQLAAAGTVGRLSRLDPAGLSPLAAELSSSAAISSLDIAGYWPMEEGVVAMTAGQSWASGLPGGAPMVISDGDQTASTLRDNWYGSKDLPYLGDVTAVATVDSASPADTAATCWWNCYIPDALDSDVTAVRVELAAGISFEIVYKSDFGIRILVYGFEGAVLEDSTVTGPGSGWYRFDLEVTQDGSDTDWALAWLEQGETSGLFTSGTFTYGAPGGVSRVILTGGGSDIALGHVVASTGEHSIYDAAGQFNGYLNESSNTRCQRIVEDLIEVPYSRRGYVSSAGHVRVPLGVQVHGGVLDYIEELAEVNGVVLDTVTSDGIRYRLANSRALCGVLELDYEAGEVAPPLSIPYDEETLVNDSTAARKGGSSYRYVLESGPASIQVAPDGVGRYADEVELAVLTDREAASQAGYRMHVGSSLDSRAESVTVDFVANPDLVETVMTGGYRDGTYIDQIDVYSELRIVNPPEWVEPGPLRYSIIGYTEEIGPATWTITYSGEQQAPHDYAFVEQSAASSIQSFVSDDLDRPDSAGATLTSAVTELATTLSVTVADEDNDRWITTSEDATAFPFNIEVGGEVMTVSGISSTTSPQTFTVSARGVYGYAAAHSAGDEVHLHIRPKLNLP